MIAPPPVWRLQVHEALASTSDACKGLAEAGEPDGAAVLARRQTAGRGTHGRNWASPPGNLYMSVLLRPAGRIAEAPQWGLLGAVAVAEALTKLLPEPRQLRLKWPNDVLLGDAKLAGLLVEAAADAEGRLDWLVLGFGVNLATAPSLTERETACIGPGAPAPEMFAADLLRILSGWRSVVAEQGFAAVRAAWLARGPASGEPVRLRVDQRRQDGCFAGLADNGALLLRSGGTVRAFAAGET